MLVGCENLLSQYECREPDMTEKIPIDWRPRCSCGRFVLNQGDPCMKCDEREVIRRHDERAAAERSARLDRDLAERDAEQCECGHRRAVHTVSLVLHGFDIPCRACACRDFVRRIV